jgi:hypothetical protein
MGRRWLWRSAVVSVAGHVLFCGLVPPAGFCVNSTLMLVTTFDIEETVKRHRRMCGL